MTNPIVNAIKAAGKELTTPEAIQWYRDTAIQTYLVIATIAVLAYGLVEQWLLEVAEVPAEAPPLDFEPFGLLMPAMVPTVAANTSVQRLVATNLAPIEPVPVKRTRKPRAKKR
jgi:hypothetical protein